jgi:putative hydrolase of the HAD superfamily
LIRAVVSDFGGVLTTPLLGSFAAFQDHSGIAPEMLGRAMQQVADADGEHPLFELERGKLTEEVFLEKISGPLRNELGREPEMHGFREVYFNALEPNEPMIALMRELQASHRMALLTNNVREWEPLWRTMLPVDEIFELVVDSAYVGMRKPEPEIYELTMERLREAGVDGLGTDECLFVDDVEVNIEAARELGMTAVHFETNEQAIPEIRKALT